jgi:ATP-dependent Lhr-like helicase
VVDVQRPTPLAFPLLVDRAREQLTSEKLADRVRRMVAPLERAAEGIRFSRGPSRGFRSGAG